MPRGLFLRKILDTLRPLYDFRAWLLLLVCFGIGILLVDPAATLGLAGYLSYILMPYIRLSDYAQSALDGNMAAALVVLARVLLLICIAISIMAWGK